MPEPWLSSSAPAVHQRVQEPCGSYQRPKLAMTSQGINHHHDHQAGESCSDFYSEQRSKKTHGTPQVREAPVSGANGRCLGVSDQD